MSETSHIETYEHGHIGVNSGDRTEREKDKGRCDSSEGWGAAPKQTGATETASRPTWLSHTKAGPRVRDKEMALKNQCSKAHQHLTKYFRCYTWPFYNPVSHPVIKSSTGSLQKGWKYFLAKVANPIRKKPRTTILQTCLLSPSHSSQSRW